MPLYEYECESCAHRFERIQKFSDPLVDTCPKCGGVVRKLLSSPAIQFKGSGWYITDYAKKSGNVESRRLLRRNREGRDSGDRATRAARKSRKASGKSSDTSSSASESKPAATPSKGDG